MDSELAEVLLLDATGRERDGQASIRGVRASYGEFRPCYEEGLRRDPNLAGRVTTRFVISMDGRVSAVRTSGNTLSDCQVVACVRTRFARLVFPPPKDKPVTVGYPIMLEPDDPPRPDPVARPPGR